MKTYKDAVETITNISAKRKVDQALGGSLNPRGNLVLEEILSIVYDLDVIVIRAHVEDLMEIAESKVWEKHRGDS